MIHPVMRNQEAEVGSTYGHLYKHTYCNMSVPGISWSCTLCRSWVAGQPSIVILDGTGSGATHLAYCAYGFFAFLERSLLYMTLCCEQNDLSRLRRRGGASPTFPIPVCPSVADFDDEEAGDPWYISLFFFTPGVASVVPFDSLRHLEQTMVFVISGRR